MTGREGLESSVVTFDDSPPGSWRGALALRDGGRTSCAACGQRVCDHPDAVWSGAVRSGSVKP